MIGDRYSLEREIGRGGMGAVWLGRDEVLGRPVAVKRVGMLPGGSSPDLLRAAREARIAASLNHPNIVGVFDLVDDGEQQYLVMEYVEGVTLSALVRDRGALRPREAARILAQVADALASAHEQNVVHRDVKPSNILVRDDGHVKLSDFGIARAGTDPSLTQTGLVTGSPAYLAPEVAQGKQATAASDVWSLGATLYHALSGSPPYEVGDNVLGAMYRIVNEPPPRLPDAGEMAPVLLATMAHDPRQRWAMEDVANALERLASDGTPGSRPTPTTTAPTQTLATAPPPTAPTTGVGPTSRPPAAPPAATGSRTTVAPPTLAPTPGEPGGRRGSVLPAVVGVLILALIALIVVLVLVDDPQPSIEAGDPTTPSADASPGSPTPSSDDPSPEEPTLEETKAAMEQFASTYVQTASSDLAAGFDLLTPAYQRQSGGLAGYRDGFWGQVSSPEILSVDADPESLVLTYRYRYDIAGRRQTETEVLQLQRDGDSFLVAGDL